MKRYYLLIFCFLFAIAGCSAPVSEPSSKTVHREIEQHPPEEFIPKTLSIVSVGDSLTQGVGDVNDLGGYISYLKAHLESDSDISQANFQNFGKAGNRTDQLMKRLEEEEVKSAVTEADLVIITIGGNDVMQIFKENITGLKLNKFIAAEDGYSKRLRDILEMVRSYNDEAHIVVIGIYNPFIKWFSDIKEMDVVVRNWNDTSAEVIHEFTNTSFVPIADIFENNEESLMYTDHFHPNNRGYELIADRVYFYLENNGTLEALKK